MRLASVVFENANPMYLRLAKALVRSVEANSPSTQLTVHCIEDKDKDIRASGLGRNYSYIDNARKTRHHCKLVQSAAYGELLCLLDCDTFVLKDLSPLEQMSGDIGYCIRPRGANFKINTGVTFVRVTDATKEFYERWYETALAMLVDRHLHSEYKKDYGGVNQCALAKLIESRPPHVRFRELACSEWNAYRETWNVDARIVHLVGDLRQAVSSGKQFNGIVGQLHSIWSQYDE